MTGPRGCGALVQQNKQDISRRHPPSALATTAMKQRWVLYLYDDGFKLIRPKLTPLAPVLMRPNVLQSQWVRPALSKSAPMIMKAFLNNSPQSNWYVPTPPPLIVVQKCPYLHQTFIYIYKYPAGEAVRTQLGLKRIQLSKNQFIFRNQHTKFCYGHT